MSSVSFWSSLKEEARKNYIAIFEQEWPTWLAGIFLAALLWVLISQGILSLEEPTALTWVVLFAIATIMAIGLSWSHIRRRLSGQADVDDVDE